MDRYGIPELISRRFSYYLESQQDAILDQWRCSINRDSRVEASESLGKRALLDHLPDILGDISRLLRNEVDESDPCSELQDDSETHGKERWTQGYSLNELILEIEQFRKILLIGVIAEFASENTDVRPESIERISSAMFDYSQLLITRSVQEYTDSKDAEVRVANDRVTAVNSQLDNTNTLLVEECRKFRDLSLKDPLTDLANRRQLKTQLLMEVDRCVRYGGSLCVIMMDLDHFKRLNDTYGHAAGDRVLVLVARQLELCSRASDQVARYGGEEFVLVLPQSDLETAAVLANRIRKALQGIELERIHETVTASFGVAQRKKGESAVQLLKRADDALYEAKAAGRNRVTTSPSY